MPRMADRALGGHAGDGRGVSPRDAVDDFHRAAGGEQATYAVSRALKSWGSRR